MIRKIFTAGLLFAAFNANAIRHGEDVTADEYMDFQVQISTSAGYCGGTLLGGKYILTARHCTPLWDDKFATDTTGHIDVWQGIEFHTDDNLAYSGQASFTRIELQELKDNVRNQYEYYIKPELDRYQDESGEMVLANAYHFTDLADDTSNDLDVAVIALNGVIQQQHVGALIPFSDFEGVTLNHPSEVYEHFLHSIGSHLTIRGWGLDENGAQPSIMQKGSVELMFADINPLRVDWEEVGIGYWDIHFNTTPYLTADAVTNQAINEGDSGTGIYDEDGRVFALFNSSTGVSTESKYHTFTGYFDWLLRTVNALNAPTAIIELFADAGVHQYQWPVRVQNLSELTVSMVPQLVDNQPQDDSSLFTLSDECNTSLLPGEWCDATLSFNSDKTWIADHVSTTIVYNDSLHGDTTTTVNIMEYVAPAEPTEPPSSDESSGSSLGGLALLALLNLALRRR